MRITIYKVFDPKDSTYQVWYGDVDDISEYLKLYGLGSMFYLEGIKALNLSIEEVYSKYKYLKPKVDHAYLMGDEPSEDILRENIERVNSYMEELNQRINVPEVGENES